MNIKKGDNVIVIAGKNKGKKGKVARVLRDLDRVVVEGVNLMKRRIRSRRAGEKGQVVDVAAPLHASNVMLFCEKCGAGRRIRKEINKKGDKVKVCVKCGKEI